MAFLFGIYESVRSFLDVRMGSPVMEHICVPHIEMKLEKLSPIISRSSFMTRQPCSFHFQMVASLRMCEIVKIFTNGERAGTGWGIKNKCEGKYKLMIDNLPTEY